MLFRILMVLLLLFCVRTADAAPLGLTVLPGPQAVISNSNSARYEFGTRFVSDASPLTYTFLIRNRTKKPLIIERVAASCDCVQALIGETSALPVKVAAGQTVPVLVTVSMHRLLPGAFSKSVWLYLHGSGDSALRLEMHGTVRDISQIP